MSEQEMQIMKDDAETINQSWGPPAWWLNPLYHETASGKRVREMAERLRELHRMELIELDNESGVL